MSDDHIAEPGVTELGSRGSLAAGLLLSVHLAYSVLQLSSLIADVIPPFVDRHVLEWSTALNFSLDLALAIYLVLINGFSLRKRQPAQPTRNPSAQHGDSVAAGSPAGKGQEETDGVPSGGAGEARAMVLFRGSSIAIAMVTLAIWGAQLHYGGSQSSQIFSLLVGTLLVVSWFLPPRTVVCLAIGATVLVAAIVLLEYLDVLPYAPLIPSEQAQRALFLDPRIIAMNTVIYLCALGLPLWIVISIQRSLRESQAALQEKNLLLQKEVLEREQAQHTLRRSLEELGAASDGQRSFMRAAAHDLRSPLTAIGGFASMMGVSENEATTRRYVDQILVGVRHMNSLLNDLSALVLSPDREITLTPTDLGLQLDVVLGILRDPLLESGGRVERGKLPWVLADENRLRRVLQNLLHNAMKFRSDSPLLIRVDAEASGPDWVMTVRDNGVGFDPKQKERIFLPFERLVATNRSEGHGLGLAICRQAVECMGGHIWAESEPGRGSAFHFMLKGIPGSVASTSAAPDIARRS